MSNGATSSDEFPIIPSGEEIVKSFFDNISSLQGVDPTIAEALKTLNAEGKLTRQAILDVLKTLRDNAG